MDNIININEALPNTRSYLLSNLIKLLDYIDVEPNDEYNSFIISDIDIKKFIDRIPIKLNTLSLFFVGDISTELKSMNFSTYKFIWILKRIINNDEIIRSSFDFLNLKYFDNIDNQYKRMFMNYNIQLYYYKSDTPQYVLDLIKDNIEMND